MPYPFPINAAIGARVKVGGEPYRLSHTFTDRRGPVTRVANVWQHEIYRPRTTYWHWHDTGEVTTR